MICVQYFQFNLLLLVGFEAVEGISGLQNGFN